MAAPFWYNFANVQVSQSSDYFVLSNVTATEKEVLEISVKVKLL